jgi:hypothetical protein
MAAVGIGVGEGGKGVLVGIVGVGEISSVWLPPLQALIRKNKRRKNIRTFLVN